MEFLDCVWIWDFMRVIEYGSYRSVLDLLTNKPVTVDIDLKVFGGKSALELLVFKEQPTELDIQIIRILIQYGADPMQIRVGKTIPYEAMKFHETIVIEMLEKIEDINIPLLDPPGINALHISAIRSTKNMLKYCLQRNADPNRTCMEGITAILLVLEGIATDEDSAEIIKDLLDYGADINVQSYRGITPLHRALETNVGYTKVIQVLLDHNPDMELENDEGLTPLNQYLKRSDSDIDINLLKDLLMRSNPNHCDSYGRNSLHLVAQGCSYDEKSLQVMEVLIAHGASVNLKDGHGNTPLHFAVYQNFTELVELFLRNGADINIKNIEGVTAFPSEIFLRKHKKLTRILMEHLATQEIRICKEIYAIFQESRMLRKMHTAYRQEIRLLKDRPIQTSSITYFEILHSDSSRIARIARNPEKRNIFSNFRGGRYRIFGKRLRKAIHDGLERRDLEDFGANFLDRISEKALPVIASQKILDYLENEDLKRLSEAVKTSI